MKKQWCAGVILLLSGLPWCANADAKHMIHMVHQTTEVETDDVYHMFRFEPNILRVNAGEVVRFMGSTGEHTVTSVQGMLPEGAQKIEIHSSPKRDIRFDVEGVYGIKCRVHNRYGMVMLLVVGDPSVNYEAAKAAPRGRLKRYFKPLFEQLDALTSAQ